MTEKKCLQKQAIMWTYCGSLPEPHTSIKLTQRTVGFLLALFLALGIPAMFLSSCSAEPSGPEIAVRVSAWVDPESDPLPREAEIWFKDHGSWRFSSVDVRILGTRPAGQSEDLYIYPDGREGKELVVPITMSADMCPQGCDRDTILINISDDWVEVVGLAIQNRTATFSRKLDIPPFFSKPTPGDMVLIPSGEFIMGTEQQDPPQVAVPEHTIDLPAYAIDIYEVTIMEWVKFITEVDFQPEGDWRPFYSIGKEEHPVSNVTWEDAKAYCEWAGKRLPTEQEWEKAARGPEGNRYPWGDVWGDLRSNSSEMGTRNTMGVGDVGEDRSPYGLYDMLGNVQEWTSEKLAPYPDSPARRDDVFRANYIGVRGGSYNVKGRSMGLYSRSGYQPDSQYGIGFRCVRDGA